MERVPNRVGTGWPRGRLAMCAALVLLLQPAGANASPLPPPMRAMGTSYALFGSGFAAKLGKSAPGKAIIMQARSALDRPPGAIAVVHMEGTLPGQGIAAQSVAAMRDMQIILDLALAWRMTRDRAYLAQTQRYLDAWTTTYQISLNPVDEGGFDKLILGYDLTKASLPAETRARTDDFLRRMATGYITAMETKKVAIPPTLYNNWQSHRIKLATLGAFEIGDSDLIARAHALFTAHLANNLHADGSTLDFGQRDALHYVTYSTDSLLLAALSASAHGQNWYAEQTPKGASLGKTLEWLARFARGDETHIEFAHSVVPFDRQRAAAGGKEYQPHPWNPASAVDTYILAARLDPQFVTLRDALIAQALASPDRRESEGDANWMMLLAASK